MKKSIWTARYSIVLSLAVTYITAACLAAAMALLPRLLSHSYGEYSIARWLQDAALIVFYACCPAGWAAIAALLRLLHNLRAGRVFTRGNVRLLRLLSWCCVWVALAALGAMFVYPPFALFFAAAGFLAIILRVVKNVMAEATALREENDLTI